VKISSTGTTADNRRKGNQVQCKGLNDGITKNGQQQWWIQKRKRLGRPSPPIGL